MASELSIILAHDDHISFMHRNIGTVWEYSKGIPPAVSAEIPDGWPTSPPTAIDIGANHRNVLLYHLILNGTQEPVCGPGSLFQTWFHQTHSAIALDEHNEAFALQCDDASKLLHLAESITKSSVSTAFNEWSLKHENSPAPVFYEEDDVIRYEMYLRARADGIHKQFKRFTKCVSDAVSRKHGLVWIVS